MRQSLIMDNSFGCNYVSTDEFKYQEHIRFDAIADNSGSTLRINEDEREIMTLVHKWQRNPNQYVRLLIEQIQPVLVKLSNQQISRSFNQNSLLTPSTNSVINEVFIYISECKYIDDVFKTYRNFCTYLGRIIRNILICKEKENRAIKKTKNISHVDYNEGSKVSSLEHMSQLLDELKISDPKAAEAISLRYYNAKKDAEIAIIMGTSIKSVELYIKRGKETIQILSNR